MLIQNDHHPSHSNNCQHGHQPAIFVSFACRMLYSVAVYYWLHVQASWADTSAQQLSVDALRFVVLPFGAFATSRGLQYLSSISAASLALYLAPHARHCSGPATRVAQQWRHTFSAQVGRVAWAQRLLQCCRSKLQASKEWYKSQLQAIATSAAYARAANLCTAVRLRVGSIADRSGLQLPDTRACCITAARVFLVMWLITAIAGPGTYNTAGTADIPAQCQPSYGSTADASIPGFCSISNLTRTTDASSSDSQQGSGGWRAAAGEPVGKMVGPGSALLQYLGMAVTWQLAAATQMLERMDLQVIKQTVRHEVVMCCCIIGSRCNSTVHPARMLHAHTALCERRWLHEFEQII